MLLISSRNSIGSKVEIFASIVNHLLMKLSTLAPVRFSKSKLICERETDRNKYLKNGKHFFHTVFNMSINRGKRSTISIPDGFFFLSSIQAFFMIKVFSFASIICSLLESVSTADCINRSAESDVE